MQIINIYKSLNVANYMQSSYVFVSRLYILRINEVLNSLTFSM